jgi:hypothetical protein
MDEDVSGLKAAHKPSQGLPSKGYPERLLMLLVYLFPCSVQMPSCRTRRPSRAGHGGYDASRDRSRNWRTVTMEMP